MLTNAADAYNRPIVQLEEMQRNIPSLYELTATVILPSLVQRLSRTDNPALQSESAWVLTKYMTSGDSERIYKVFYAGAVPPLVQLLTSSHENVREQAVRALDYIIADEVLHKFVIQLGQAELLLNLIESKIPITFLCNITRVIVSICRSKDHCPSVKTIQKSLSALKVLIMRSEVNILENTLWAITYLAGRGNYQIQMVNESGIVSKLIPLLSHKEVKVQTVAVKAIGNICIGTDKQTQVVLNYGALCHLSALLSHQKESIRKDATWVISNITAGTHCQIQEVIDAGLIPKIVENLRQGEFQVQKEATWAISNLCKGGTNKQVATLISSEVISPFCNMLYCKDMEVIYEVLDGLWYMLRMAGENAEQAANVIKKCGGIVGIKQLKYNVSSKTSYLANMICEQYFDGDEQDVVL